jgi:hypothetical protein
MRFAGGAGAIGATVLVMGAIAAMPAAAQPSTSCSSSIHHLSGLSEYRSSCAEARKLGKYAEKHNATYVPKHYGFKCHGESSQFGEPPISYTCKKGNARVYFTLSN